VLIVRVSRLLLLVVISAVMFVSGCGGSSNGAEGSVTVGDILTVTGDVIPAATSQDNYTEMMKFVTADDRVGFQEMHSRGQLILLEKGTKVRLLQATFRGYEVRVQDGDHENRVVWVSRELIE
jgi:protein involved in sex pheromone biosynthesis